jgi:nucleotide-binding universal stress UspA family protein
MLSVEKRMLPLEHIAVLTDIKGDLIPTLDYAANLCRWYNADLLLFHSSDEKSLESTRQTLTELMAQRQWCDIHAKIIVSKAEMNHALEDLETYSPDLLILTTRAKANVRKWVAGSVTQQVFRQTRRPVLVLGPEIVSHQNRSLQPCTRILYATDMSAVSVMALHYAAGITHDHEAQLTALYVEADPEKGFTADHVFAEQRLRDWMRDHAGGMVHAIENARISVDFGAPATHILAAANDQKPDLIVMGAQGAGAMTALASRFLGGTAYEVCCNAKCPLLIVPEAH